jgi:hypothetical protein
VQRLERIRLSMNQVTNVHIEVNDRASSNSMFRNPLTSTGVVTHVVCMRVGGTKLEDISHRSVGTVRVHNLASLKVSSSQGSEGGLVSYRSATEVIDYWGCWDYREVFEGTVTCEIGVLLTLKRLGYEATSASSTSGSSNHVNISSVSRGTIRCVSLEVHVLLTSDSTGGQPLDTSSGC